jgi:MFS transporter, ACS family, hexuronate transporter
MADEPSRPGGPLAVMTRYRWVICGLLFYVTTANYIDRGVFGNLAPELGNLVHWDAEQYWNMQVAFLVAYALSNAVAGRIIDWLGLRLGLTLAVTFWGLASMGHFFARTPFQFGMARVFLGLGEGGNFPAANKTVAEWFPKRESALAISLFNSGSNMGGIIVPFGLPLLVALFGWQGWNLLYAFLLTGLIDLVFVALWLTTYKKPEEHPGVSPAELAHIQSDPPEPAGVKIRWRRLFPYRQTWAFLAAKGLTDCFWWFYLFGAAPFFSDRFHLGLAARSTPITLIYVLATIGGIAGGWLSGHLMHLGWTLNRARKTTLLICALLVVPVFYAPFTESSWVAMTLIAIAAAAHQGWSCNVFATASDMFPRRVVASVTGLGGMAGAIAGIGLFVFVGKVVKLTGEYGPVFFAASLAYVAALLIMHLLAPRMEPAKIDVPAAA